MDTIFSKALDDFFEGMAEMTEFSLNVFKEGLKPPYEFREVANQCYDIGIKSFVLVAITAFILGLVLVMQSRPTMMEMGAGALLPAMSSVSIVREMGPLITGLVCAGKIGSGISAELGSMKVTEQIDAMEVSGTNPFKYLVATRIIAATIMIPVLTVYADFISLMGAFTGANIKDTLNFHFFFNQVFEALHFTDVVPSLIKTFFFGFTIALVGCTKGYNSQKGTEGVGRAANISVVVSMVGVIIIDMVVTQITSLLGYL
jgi:phospholipid/cholesterol/gamma-HCH transport system permease protein